MRIGLALCATASAMMLVFAWLQGGAEAAPKGWKCDYSVSPIGFGPFGDTQTYFYSCYGRNLSETRARARGRCSRLPSCNTGACVPLNYTPRQSCDR